MNYQIEMKRLLFLRQLRNHPDRQLLTLLSCFARTDNLEVKYCIDIHDTPSKIKLKLRNHFEAMLTGSNIL